LPHLETLIEGDDPGLAAKAASLAGFIGGPGSTEVLAAAAQHEDPRVRVAAAGSARNLSGEEASAVLVPLIGDDDVGVQITALKSLPADPTPELQAEVVKLARNVELPEVVHSMIPQLEGVPQRKKAPSGASTAPLLREMPGFEGFSGSYNESLSADDIVGQEAEMPGAVTQRVELAAAGIEQEMPGFGAVAESGGMDEEDHEMPGFGAP
jgi:hypothetical protein